MIAQISNGAQFAGLVNYANDIAKKDTVIVASEGVCISSNATITASFQAQANTRPTLKNFVGHVSLSFAPQDTPKLTDELIAEIAREYLRRMGITNTQFVMFRHKDQPHAHVHIVYNRVNNDGKTITGDTNFIKSAAVTKALTRAYGLTFGKGKKDVRRERLRGKDAIKYRLYDAVKDALKGCRSWDELRSRLAEKGIRMELVQRPGVDGKVRMGVVFSHGNVSFAGGKIDRSLTFGSINKVLGVGDKIDTNGIEIRKQQLDTLQQGQGAERVSQTAKSTERNSSLEVQPSSQSDGSDNPSSAGSGIAESVMEILLQPHEAPSVGGGGGENNRGWNDDDKEKNKNRPYRRRR